MVIFTSSRYATYNDISIKREELPNNENNLEIVIDENIRSFKNDV